MLRKLLIGLCAGSCAAVLANAAMAQTTIVQLPAGTNPTNTDAIPSVESIGGVLTTVKVTPPQIVAAGLGGVTGFLPTNNPTFTGTLTGPDITLSDGLGTNNIFSTTTNSATGLLVKNGPYGDILMQLGAGADNIIIRPNVGINFQNWAYSNSLPTTAPLFANTTPSGSTSAAGTAFDAFFQHFSTVNFSGNAVPIGIYEVLNMSGGTANGGYIAGQFNVNVTGDADTANQEHLGIGSKCNLLGTFPVGSTGTNTSTCFGENPVAHLGGSGTIGSIIGSEVDTWAEANTNPYDRIGIQIVDVQGGGKQASHDDVALSFNNQYAPSSTLGYKIGLEFGRTGGSFPVSTGGTLIYGQHFQGGTWTVANGIDWNLGTATNNWLNLGGKFVVNGSGAVQFTGTLTGPVAAIGSSSLFTGPLTSQTYGSPAINVSSLFWGLNAGAAFPSTGSDLFPSVGIGAHALQNFTALQAETTCVGAEACQFLTNGGLTTAVGMHSLGSETSAQGNVAIGTDALRDEIGSGYNVAVGEGAEAHGTSGTPNIAIGGLALYGNSSSVLLSGAITAGNTFTLQITNGGPYTITNLPFSYTHTVAGGDTLSSILTDVCTHISSQSIQGPSYTVACYATLAPDGVAYLSVNFPGTQSNGWQLAVTGTSAIGSGGSNTLTVTNQGGLSASQMVAIGANALQSDGAVSNFNSTAVGYQAAQSARSSQYSTYIGGYAGHSVTTGGSNTFVGANAGIAATTQANDTLVGFQSGNALTTGTGLNTAVGISTMLNSTTAFQNTVIGARTGEAIIDASSTVEIGWGVGYTTLQHGANNILIGTYPLDGLSATQSNYITINNTYVNYAAVPAITTGQALGTTPVITGGGSHVFKAVVGASPTGTTETLTFSAAPNGWMCVANDVTTSSNTAKITASSATSVTMTWSGTLTASDVVLHMCDAY